MLKYRHDQKLSLMNNTCGSSLEILVSIAYAQMPLINALADISSKARCLNFTLSLSLHSYFVYASSEGSDESGHMRRLD